MTDSPSKIILYLAPLRGFTGYIFRNAFMRHFGGFDVAVSPFIPTVPAARVKKTHLNDVLPANNRSVAVIPQIIGNNPADFIPLAQRLFDLGYETVNWNLGCPFPMVAKKQRGSGLLPHPQKIEAFLEATLPAIPNRLSIKARLGRKKTDDILPLLVIFNRYPLDEVIIHPRTGQQMYDGEPNLDMFEKCLDVSAHSLVYNGDINDLATFKLYSQRFKTVDRWMIGRGALINPFLPAAIKNGQDDVADKVKAFRAFYDDLFAQYRRDFSGPGHLLDRMKGFWTYFSQAFKDGRNIKKKIHRTRKLDRYLEIVERFFEEEAFWNG
ncbi:MAG: tRNA-dihydrouridine synthase family protein [Deltaproteobacteria bacterium]|jgi:tRNA-dihydrouridine synthase|nr:tRNA-dihydrouridine synthase family protein [Deltaproteobacteria bacterium]